MVRGRKAAAAVASITESEKENVNEGSCEAVAKSPPPRATGKGLKNSRNWEEEVEVMAQQLNKMKLEKQVADTLIQQQESKIKEQQDLIVEQSKEQDKLREELKKLQEPKEPQPVLSTTFDESSDDTDRVKKAEENAASEDEEREEEEVKKVPRGRKIKAVEDLYPIGEEDEKKEVKKKATRGRKKVTTEDAGSEEEKEEVKKATTKGRKKIVKEEAATEDLGSDEGNEGAQKATKGAKGGRKGKSKADEPGKPKRALSAYMLFGMEYRKTLQQEMPGAKLTEITACVAGRWKEMSDEEKQPYADQAAVGKQKYQEAMEEFKKSNPN